ncbi:MAG: sugar ABC transporter substrate-binding protein [Armatimonadia bacterium]
MTRYRLVSYFEGRHLAALVCLAIVACLSTARAQTPQPTVLQMVAWRNPGERTLSGTVDLLGSFQDSNPNLRVNLTQEKWSDARARLRYWCGSLARYAPDLTVMPDVWLSQFADSLLPLDDYLKPRDIAGIAPAVLDRCRLDGKLYGLPWLVRSRVLYYRQDLFEAAKLKPPKTLEELQAAAVALSEEKSLYPLGLPAAPGGAMETFWGFLMAFDGPKVDERGDLDLCSEQAVKALGYWLGLQQAGLTQPEGLTWTTEELEEQFAAGKVGMLFSGPELARYLRASRPGLKFGMCPLPGAKGPLGQVSCEVMVVFKNTQNAANCGRFARFMASGEAQRAMWLMGGLPTYRQHIAEAAKDATTAPFVAQLEGAQGLPLQQPGRVSGIVERALWLALSGRADAATALQQAVKEEAQRLF